MTLFDMHCHLGFAVNAAALARAFGEAGGGALCCTVEPDEYERLQRVLPGSASVRLGLGLHPWWLANGRCGEADVARCERLAEEAAFIGEVGLDFGPRNAASRDGQLDAFERICAVAGEAGGKAISVHSVRAAKEVLDVLERTGCVSAGKGEASCACILHWYSGPSDQLSRAIRLGCYFSLGESSLATRRGREYARVIPVDRLLLETDLPEEACNSYDFARIGGSLARALAGIEEVRGEPVADAIERNSRRILDR